ncbi:MAG: PHP domain-containing protein [Vampirovibrionales bacterium]|nr:PHP domain-containing protein [Vampirovibrionales bacterium]
MTVLDLHMHTVYSDGASTPEELVSACAAQNLSAIAVTDHDTVSSLPYVQACGEAHGLEIIPGIEINTVWDRPLVDNPKSEGSNTPVKTALQEVHVLGYFINPNASALIRIMDSHYRWRLEQIAEMVDRINHKHRLFLDFDAIQERSGLGTLGRPHIAQAIVEKKGAYTVSEAFTRYLKPNCPTYVRRKTATPHEAVEAIHESGGIPVIAHPGEMEGIEKLTVELMDYGLRGLEAYHRSHSPGVIEFHCSLAEKYGLIVTGGTDFHGTGDAYAKALERLHMPSFVYERLSAERKNRQHSLFKAS